ncbi:uncharacterized protein EHS24_007321 [Apiotrichum porosum]|uniref:Major facilitator superfamily (MFS) profile domain-containing protein n=1 Tax=Apiotrichum porosum TaxID=105984 RepID=A0A427XU21_9TREE|nr:uncharacterized protein EHS24_007321 [Apiotrichum porosum]RSH82354.1 hypothetical protein EHS24_007321 [Apiotrichum porosum]
MTSTTTQALAGLELSKETTEHIDKADRAADDGFADIPLSKFAAMPTSQLIRKFWRLYLCGLSVSLAAMYIGYTVSTPGNVVANQGFINQFGTVHNAQTGALELNASHISLWAGFSYVAQITTQILSPISGDRYGRRFNMYCFTMAMVIAIILEIVAKDWKVYLVAKVFSGLCCGFLGTTVMAYMSEITMPQMRGTLLASFSFSWSLGGLFSAIGLQVLATTAPLEYKRIFYSEFVLLAIWLPPLFFLPESPAWLADKGKDDKAKKSLRRLVGKVDGYDVDYEYSCIKAEMDQSKALLAAKTDNGWKALFKGSNLKRALISTIPFTFQNFVGVPLVYGNTTYFFQTAGLQDAFLGSLIISIIGIFGIGISFLYLVERVGRRTLVLVGSGVCIVCCLIIGVLGTQDINDRLAIALITLCSVWVLFYSFSLGPIGWMALVEISSPVLRAKTAAMATVIQSCTGVLFNYTVPLMLSPQYAGWGTKIGFFFAGLSVLYWIPTYLWFPETKGRSYAALDELFERGVSPRHFAKTKTSVEESAEVMHPTA